MASAAAVVGPAAIARAGTTPAAAPTAPAPAAPAPPAPPAPAPAAAPLAAAAGPRAMSLAAALAYARAHHPRAVAARARLAAAAAQARVPDALWDPRVAAAAEAFAATENNTTASYASPYGVDLVRIGGTRAVTGAPALTPDASTLVAVGLRQEVFDFGRIAALSAAASAAADVERARAAGTELDVELGVEEAFYAVRTAHAVAAAADAAVQRAQVARDTAAAGIQSGLRRPIDLTRAEAELARYDVGRIRARAGVVAAQALFAAAVGVPELALDAAAEPAADEPAAAEPAAAEPPTAAPAAALAAALRADPDVAAAAAAAAQQAAVTRAIAAELRPDLSVTAALDGRAGGAAPSSGPTATGDGLLPYVANWDVGLVLTWPLVDGVVRARADASRQLEVARRAEADDVRARVTAEVAQAIAAVDVARQALPALQRALDAARATDDQAQARFAAGLDTQLELADAEALRTSAEIELAVGQFQAEVARARLGRLLGERAAPAAAPPPAAPPPGAPSGATP